MRKVLLLLSGIVVLLLPAGCASVQKPDLNVRSFPPAQRIGITPVPFCEPAGKGFKQVEADGHLAYLIVTGLEDRLAKKGYGPFFMPQHLELIPPEDLSVISSRDVLPAIRNSAMTTLPRTKDQQRAAGRLFEKVEHILVPVFVHKSPNAAMMIFGRTGSFEVDMHLFLIETATGEITWHQQAGTWGTYAFIEKALKQGRLVDDLLKGFPYPDGKG